MKVSSKLPFYSLYLIYTMFLLLAGLCLLVILDTYIFCLLLVGVIYLLICKFSFQGILREPQTLPLIWSLRPTTDFTE